MRIKHLIYWLFCLPQLHADVLHVKVFSEDPRFGNLAGVVLDAESLVTSEMQAIAKRVNASETAFVFPSSKASFALRWFTPNTEVGFCIHATLAALAALEAAHSLKDEEIFIETQHTTLRAKKIGKKWFIRTSDYVVLKDLVDLDLLCSQLQVKKSDLLQTPTIVQIFNDRELVIQVDKLSVLKNLNPELSRYAALCKALHVTGISLFTQETFDSINSCHTREFAPLYGYLEDPLCGLAAGAIGAYLRDRGDTRSLHIEQGHFLQSPGVIEVIQDGSDFWIGGFTTIVSPKSQVLEGA